MSSLRKNKIFHQLFFILVLWTSILFTFEDVKEFKIDFFKNFTLKNGLEVYLIEEKGIPLVFLDLIFKAGESSTQINYSGLATVTAEGIFSGTKKMKAYQIQDRLDFFGVKTKIKVADNYTHFSFIVLKEYFEPLLNMLSELIQESLFPNDEIMKKTKRLISEWQMNRINNKQLAFETMYYNFFKGSPLFRLFPTRESLSRITGKDCFLFSKRFYIPNNSIFILRGDLEHKTTFEILEKNFSGWERGQILSPFLYIPPKRSDANIILVDNPSSENVNVLFCIIFPSFDNSFRFPILVMNQILSGNPFSRLYLNLRESKNILSSVESYLKFFNDFALFYIYVTGKEENARRIIEETFSEIKKFSESKIDKFELENAKNYLKGNCSLSISYGERLVEILKDKFLYSLPDSFINNYIYNISEVDESSVERMVKRYIKFQPFLVIVVGRKNNLIEKIKDLGKIELFDNNLNLIKTQGE
ncbi:MAG: pitrilysin family protein [Acidobacteriota bacterium]